MFSMATAAVGCTVAIAVTMVSTSVCGAQTGPATIDPDVIRIAFLGRTIERLLIVVVAAGALFCGFKLFDTALASESSLEAGVLKYKLKLTKIGPGIFFALFGTVVCLYALFAAPRFESFVPEARTDVLVGVGPTIPVTTERQKIALLIKSIGTLERLERDQEALSPEERAAAREAVRNLATMRAQLVDEYFHQKGTYATWARQDALRAAQPQEFLRLSQKERDRFFEVDALVSKTLLSP